MQDNQELPYGADFKLVVSIVETVGRLGKLSTTELYKNVNAKNAPLKSYSKKMAEFLGLIKQQNNSLELTETGKLFVANRNDTDRKKFLANNLPKKYMMLLSWIKDSEEGVMKLNDLKQAIIRNHMEDKPNHKIYDWMLNTFANYSEYVGVADYIKGQESRCQITNQGIEVLRGVGSETREEKNEADEPQQAIRPRRIFYADVGLGEGTYPIRILTKSNKPFDWDIQNAEDWVVVEKALEAIKRRWQSNNQRNAEREETPEDSAE